MYVIRFTGYDVPVRVIPCVPIDRVCVSSLYVDVCVDPLVLCLGAPCAVQIAIRYKRRPMRRVSKSCKSLVFM